MTVGEVHLALRKLKEIGFPKCFLGRTFVGLVVTKDAIKIHYGKALIR